MSPVAASPIAQSGSAALGVWAVLLPVLSALLVSSLVWRWFPWLIHSTRDLARLRVRPGGGGRGPRRARLITAGGSPVPAITWLVGGGGLVLSWVVGMALPGALTGTWADLPVLAGIGAVAGVTGWLAWIDGAVHRLPNRIVLPLGAVVLACLGVSVLAAALGAGGVAGFVAAWAMVLGRAVACGAALCVFFVLVAALGGLLSRRAMGMGDVKLAFPAGVLAGLFSPWGLVLALLVMNVAALLELAVRWLVTGRRPGGSVAFGPHMLIGTWTAVLVTGLFL